MTPVEPALRGILVGGLMLLVGTPPTFRLVVFPELERWGFDTARADRTAVRILSVSIVGTLLGGTGLAVHQAGAVYQAGLVEIGSFSAWAGSTAAGGNWLMLVWTALILGSLTVGRHVRPDIASRRRWLDAAFVGGIIILVAFSLTRYSTAVGNPMFAIVAKIVHMAGAAVWFGGLMVLATFPTLVDCEANSNATLLIPPLVRRFSMIAVAGLTVAFGTGILIAAWHVPTAAALVTTSYGVLLLAKVGLVLVATAFGVFNRFVLCEAIKRSIQDRGEEIALPGLLTVPELRIEPSNIVETFVRSIRLELAVLVIVVAMSVMLTTAATPSYLVLDVPASTGTVGTVGTPTGFSIALELCAIGVVLTGSLILGYEFGEFRVRQQ